MTLLIIAIIISFIIFYLGYRSDTGKFKMHDAQPYKDTRSQEDIAYEKMMEEKRKRVAQEELKREEAKKQAKIAKGKEELQTKKQEVADNLIVTVEKNNFEEKVLWENLVHFSRTIFADIKKYPENRLHECMAIGIYPALEFILEDISKKYDFYNLPNNGVYENFDGTLFEYCKTKINPNISLGKLSVLSYLTFLPDHQNPTKINEQINYIFLKKIMKNGKEVLAFTSAKNFLFEEKGKSFCSWDYLGEIAYLNLPLLSKGDESSIQTTNWRTKLDVHNAIRSTDEDIAEVTIIVTQFLNRIQGKQFKKLDGYFETRF